MTSICLYRSHFSCLSSLFALVSVFLHHANVLCDELVRIHTEGSTDPTSKYATSGIDMQDYFLRFTLDSFAQIGFGFDMNSICAESNKFAIAFDYAQSRCFNRMDYGVFWPWIMPADAKLKGHLKYMDDVVYACITKAKSKSRAELIAKQLHEPDLLTQTLLDMTGEEQAKGSGADKRLRRMHVSHFATQLFSSMMYMCFHPDKMTAVIRIPVTMRVKFATLYSIF